MKKAKIILLVFLIFVLIAAAVVVVGAVDKKYDVFRLFGESEKNAVSDDPTVLAAGDTLSVTEADIAPYLTDESDSREKAILHVLRGKALYNEAVRCGYEINDERVNTQIEYEKSFMADISEEQKKEFAAYLEGKDMTVDEYWESQRDDIRLELTIYDYLLPKKNEFAKDHSVDGGSENVFTVNGFDMQQNDQWQAEIFRIADELIKKDNVVYR